MRLPEIPRYLKARRMGYCKFEARLIAKYGPGEVVTSPEALEVHCARCGLSETPDGARECQWVYDNLGDYWVCADCDFDDPLWERS